VNSVQIELGPILKQLLTLSPEQVDAELEAIQRQRAGLDAYENALRAVRTIAGSGSEPTLPDEQKPTLRKAIMRVMAEEPNRGWRPAEVRLALDEKGWGPSGKNARNQIQNRLLDMLDRSELSRRDGKYFLIDAVDLDGGGFLALQREESK
jgi:hypothetical protein